MPTEINNPQTLNTNNDPRNYIRNLSELRTTDMAEKSQAELDRANVTMQRPEQIKQEGKEEISFAKKVENFRSKTEEGTGIMNISAERVEEISKSDKKNFEDALEDFTEGFDAIYKQITESFPKEILQLAQKFPEAKELGVEVQKLIEFMNSLNNIRDALSKSREAYSALPEGVIGSLEKLEDGAQRLKIIGEKKIEEAKELENSKRFKKLKEIANSAEKNLKPVQRTMGRESSNRFAREGSKNFRRLIAGKDVQRTQDLYDNAYLKKVETRITNNMQEQNRTPEEIAKTVETAKKRINDAIEEEKQKSIPVTTTPSSYTTPRP